jgi:drug/metabolite transporter (DMT)-like permease
MQALWMVLASFLFASMGVCVKLASSNFNAFELVLYRGLVGMVFMGLIVQARGSGLRTRFPGMQAWRSLIGNIAPGRSPPRNTATRPKPCARMRR